MVHAIKVFLVDHDLITLNKYRQGLENIGYKDIHLFLNGVICINNLHLKPFIIFLNHPIDESSGFDVLKKIRQHHPNIYVVIMSNEENVNLAVDVVRNGAFDYIVKGDNEISKMSQVIERIFLVDR
jgi:polysaccharide export outer membrane protein